MPSIRKPQPKSQKEISNGLVDPYVSPETGQSLGNPNTQTEFNQFSANDQNGVGFSKLFLYLYDMKIEIGHGIRTRVWFTSDTLIQIIELIHCGIPVCESNSFVIYIN